MYGWVIAQVLTVVLKFPKIVVPEGHLVTTSASGLDPDISPQSAEYQVATVAKARGMSPDAVRAVVARHTEQPLLGFLGQPRVHVLELNLDLDGLLQ